MLNRKYNRIFILLNGKNEGTGINLNGSCDIEIINGKVKLYSYVGGIGRLREKRRSLYLISSKGKYPIAVSAGEFEMKGSNAVLEKSVDPDNVFGSGMAVEDITAAAVWNAEEGPFRAVLEGFVTQRFNWQKNLGIFGESAMAEAETEDRESKSKEPDEYEENYSESTLEQADINEEATKRDDGEIQAAEACQAYYSPHDTFREISEKFRRELDMLDEIGIIDKSFILGNEDKDKDSGKSTEIKKADKYVKNEITKKKAGKPAVMSADRLFEYNPRLAAGGSTEWIRADYREIYFIPGAIKSLRQLFVRNSARKGKHMIAGRDGEKYYIGVPGSEAQKEEANLNGFYDFLTIGDMNGAGYWIKEL